MWMTTLGCILAAIVFVFAVPLVTLVISAALCPLFNLLFRWAIHPKWLCQHPNAAGRVGRSIMFISIFPGACVAGAVSIWFVDWCWHRMSIPPSWPMIAVPYAVLVLNHFSRTMRLATALDRLGVVRAEVSRDAEADGPSNLMISQAANNIKLDIALGSGRFYGCSIGIMIMVVALRLGW
jgi:hypothetical protein